MTINQSKHSSGSLVDKLSREVEDNLKNEQFGVEELAEKVGMSRSNLHRKLQEATGQSISQFIREYRLKKAMEMLQVGEEITASELANQVGFGSATYFSKSFTDFYGYPPGEAKKRFLEQENDTEEKPIQNSRHKLYLTIGGSILILAILFLLNIPNRTSTEEIIAQDFEKSIAVLPFKNISSDVDNQYFADGVMDAILNKLAKIGELRVKSRTSVEKYRDANLSIPEIAQELGVTYILEGSAQKYGDDIKITTQLIKVSTDDHLWSEEYTRKFKDVLSLQGEIAGRVADELQTVLTAKEQAALRRVPTTNPKAYDLYLLAVFQFNKSTAESLSKAIDLYEQALEVDPNFVDAYVGLAQVYSFGGLVWGIFPENEALAKIQPSLKKALLLDSLNGKAYGILASSQFYYQWNFREAKKNYDKSIQSGGAHGNADFYIKMGSLDIAGRINQENINREPAMAFRHAFKAEILYHSGEVEEAVAYLDHARELFEDHYFLREAAKLYYNFGEIEKSRIIFEQVKANFPDRPPLFYWLEAVHAHQSSSDTQVILTELKNAYESESSGSPAWFLAIFYAVVGEEEQVFDWLERSYQRHEVEMTWLKMEPMLRSYRNNPRYVALLEKMDFPE